MNKQTIIDKFLKDKDLKEHELVYWKHKVSNGFKLKKFMEDFIDYYTEQLRLGVVVRQSEQLKEGHKNSFKYWLEENNYKKVYDKYVKWGFEYSESELIAKYNEEVMNL